jgi:hypothetical protein
MVVGEGNFVSCPQFVDTQHVVWLNVALHYILCFLLTQTGFEATYLLVAALGGACFGTVPGTAMQRINRTPRHLGLLEEEADA